MECAFMVLSIGMFASSCKGILDMDSFFALRGKTLKQKSLTITVQPGSGTWEESERSVCTLILFVTW
jgi:hypothetical protein